jgi:hypothetical protein
MNTLTAYTSLEEQINLMLWAKRDKKIKNCDQIILHTYWQVGKYIVMQEGTTQKGYSDVLHNLPALFSRLYGKGFSRSNMSYMRRLFLTFPSLDMLSPKLTWSHYFNLLKARSDLEMKYIHLMAAKNEWSVKEVKQFMRRNELYKYSLGSIMKDLAEAQL